MDGLYSFLQIQAQNTNYIYDLCKFNFQRELARPKSDLYFKVDTDIVLDKNSTRSRYNHQAPISPCCNLHLSLCTLKIFTEQKINWHGN